MRQEEDSINGWRAVNIYQIGAVLHDLIMKKELFAGIEPYPVLVIAIKEDMPSIINNDYHPDLIQLTREMLQKDWKNRLRMNTAEKIKSVLEKCLLPKEEQEIEYNYIKNNAQQIKEKLADIENIERSKAEKEKRMESTHLKIWNIIDGCFNEKELKDITKKIEASKSFKLDNFPDKIPMMRYKFYKITGELKYGFAQEFLILFNVENNESSFCKISVLGIIQDLSTKSDLSKPHEMMYKLFTDKGKYPRPEIRITNPPEIKVPPCSVFEGIVELEDNSLKNLINKKIAMILKDVVRKMEPDVLEELKKREERINSDLGVYVTTRLIRQPYFITV